MKSLDATLNTEKCFGVFARSSARQSGDREHARARVCVYVRVYFFILGLSPGLSPLIHPPPRFSHGRRTRRGRFISTPVAIVPFVSQPALHASRRRAFSFHLLYLSASHRLSFSPCLPLCHPCSSWQIRAVDESTRRYLDISANTRLMRDADVFIHRRTFPILTNDAPHRTLLV